MLNQSGAKKLKKLVKSDPYAKGRLAVELGLASTSTIDKWVKSGKLPRLRQAAILVAIQKEVKSK